MKREDIERSLKKLAGLFPGQVTQEHVKVLYKHFEPLETKAVNDAIAEHSTTRERFNLAQLIEGCRAKERAAIEKRDNSAGEGTWFDVRRRMNPQLADACDTEVALRIYRNIWIKSSQSEGYRRKCLSECSTMLFIAGVPLEHTQAWAEYIFTDPGSFATVLEDIRRNLQRSSAA